MLIWGLWEIQIEAINYVRFVDADAETYKTEGMYPLFHRWEIMKKDKHGQNCHDQMKHSSPFVLSGDGIMGKEAQVVLATLS